MEAVQELTREHLQQSVHHQRRYCRDKLHTYHEGQKVHPTLCRKGQQEAAQGLHWALDY